MLQVRAVAWLRRGQQRLRLVPQAPAALPTLQAFLRSLALHAWQHSKPRLQRPQQRASAVQQRRQQQQELERAAGGGHDDGRGRVAQAVGKPAAAAF